MAEQSKGMTMTGVWNRNRWTGRMRDGRALKWIYTRSKKGVGSCRMWVSVLDP